MNVNRLFPAFLKLEELSTLIVGGGAIGLEKILALLGNSPDARVTVVAEEVREEIIALATHHPRVQVVARNFEPADLNGMDLVFVATGDEQENRRIQNLSRSRHLLTNVADTPALCDFYLSGIVKKGDLKIAISTNGKSPTIARRIKEVLDECFPSEIDETINELQRIRQKLTGDFAEKVRQLNQLTRSLVS